MTTTPRRHHRDPDQRIPAPSAAVGGQDLDTYVDDPAEPMLEDPDARRVEVADTTTSTADGSDLGRETGELYGQGIAPTGDVDADGVRSIQDYDEDDGHTWLEALQESAAENGTAGDAAIDDVRHTEADQRRVLDEAPVADRGSGGPGGL